MGWISRITSYFDVHGQPRTFTTQPRKPQIDWSFLASNLKPFWYSYKPMLDVKHFQTLGSIRCLGMFGICLIDFIVFMSKTWTHLGTLLHQGQYRSNLSSLTNSSPRYYTTWKHRLKLESQANSWNHRNQKKIFKRQHFSMEINNLKRFHVFQHVIQHGNILPRWVTLWDELNHTVHPGGSRKNRDEHQKYSLALAWPCELWVQKSGPSLGHAAHAQRVGKVAETWPVEYWVILSCQMWGSLMGITSDLAGYVWIKRNS